MILTAHQPTYLPWAGLFHKIILADKFVSFNKVQYVPKDWINRNKIKGSNGEITLSVPVKHKNHFQSTIFDIEIDNTRDWKKKHWNSIFMSYKKSNYFLKYIDFFEDLYSKDWFKIHELNEYILKWVLSELDINIEFLLASDYNFEGKKNLLILDMCKKLKAEKFIFGEQGGNYADIKLFKENRISIFFQKYKQHTYAQLYGSFIPNLSVIDILFNSGKSSKDVIMKGNILKI